ncbi:testican-1 isoform X2 [Eubalaena glacialis]|uniref:testican-1 isoform X2 n=1 Tax=Eubalaena glacialis TaxID=27606 RepID=UPI002A59AC7B|nr:testican-1 isoform X2 [Eubalaena glacialis]
MPAIVVLAAAAAAWCFLQVESRHLDALAGGAAPNNGNFLDNDQWLSTVSQYDRDKYWNRFRDDDYFRDWNPNKPFDQALDPSKDPCLKVKCSPHKVCVTQDYQTALCVSRKHLLPRQKKGNVAHRHWVGPSNLVKCKPCPTAQSAMVCGSDGHTYTSKCKLEFHACSTGKSLTALCDGPCPCLPEPKPPKHKAEKNACTDKELRNLASRLKDWFGALHEDANRVVKPTSSDTAQGSLPCQNEMNRIQKLSKGKSLLGAFIPRCNEEGYYKATQCHGSTGQCWCVDKYGNELAGSRKQGAVSCEEEQETSGDFGSGGSVVLLDDLEDEWELGPKDKAGKLRVHARAVTEDDEDEDDEKEDEVGYIW